MSETAAAIADEALATSTPPPAPEPEAEVAKAPTEYHVLRVLPGTSPSDPHRYELVGENVPAPGGASAAVKTVVVASEKPQTFIAVPSRSWKPITVTVETKTQLKLS